MVGLAALMATCTMICMRRQSHKVSKADRSPGGLDGHLHYDLHAQTVSQG